MSAAHAWIDEAADRRRAAAMGWTRHRLERDSDDLTVPTEFPSFASITDQSDRWGAFLLAEENATPPYEQQWIGNAFLIFESGASGVGLRSGQSPLDNARELLRSYAGALSAEQRRRFEAQLEALLKNEEELHEEGIRPSMLSLSSLLAFFSTLKAFEHPNLSLTRDGAFTASWWPHKGAKFSITFSDVTFAEWFGVDLSSDIPPSRGSFVPAEVHDMPQHFAAWIGR